VKFSQELQFVKNTPEARDNDMKFLPSLTRLIVFHGLAAAIVLGTAFYAFSPFFLRGPWAGKDPGYQKPSLKRLTWEYLQGQRDVEHMITLVPLMIFTLVTTAYLLVWLVHMREIPKYVELRPDGVCLGRWVDGDQFIPYHRIADIYERYQSRYIPGAICIIIFGGQKSCILKYAYPDWPVLYQETQRRIGPVGTVGGL
jgi:hypothetical protein